MPTSTFTAPLYIVWKAFPLCLSPAIRLNVQPNSCRFSFPLPSLVCTILIDLTAERSDEVLGGGVNPIESMWFRKFCNKLNSLDFPVTFLPTSLLTHPTFKITKRAAIIVRWIFIEFSKVNASKRREKHRDSLLARVVCRCRVSIVKFIATTWH